jgi:hypothetical protein
MAACSSKQRSRWQSRCAKGRRVAIAIAYLPVSPSSYKRSRTTLGTCLRSGLLQPWVSIGRGACRTIGGYEAMHTIHKDQIRWVAKGDVVA